MKKCCKCKIEKSLDLFSKDRNRKDGLKLYCKDCSKAYAQTAANKYVVVGTTKACFTCKAEKPFDAFSKNRGNRDGLQSSCKSCDKAYNQLKLTKPHVVESDVKVCLKCKQTKSLVSFSKKRNHKDGYHCYCKSCLSTAKPREPKPHVAEGCKLCNICKTGKTFDAFNKNTSSKDGLSPKCKDCDNAESRRWRAENPEKLKQLSTNWRLNNKDHCAKRAKAYQQNNRTKMTAIRAKRRARKLDATPVWAIDFFAHEAYDLAILREKMTGFKWQVDHIVPLQGRKVCGLHVHTNLQVIPAIANQKKSNTFNDEAPLQAFGLISE